MPRKGKQAARTIPGQTYGSGVEQETAMKVMPLSDEDERRQASLQVAAEAVPPGAAAAPSGAAAAAPPMDFTAALEAARSMVPPQGELAVGGPMPPGFSPHEGLWTQLARATGDPGYLRLAQQARLMRGA